LSSSHLESFQGDSNWNKVIGNIWEVFGSPNKINITTDAHTQITIFDRWRHIPISQKATATFRTSEYTGTDSDPLLELTYTPPTPPPVEEEEEPVGWDIAIIGSLICSGLLLFFIAGKFDKKEHFIFRIFLLFMSLLIIIIAINIVVIVCGLNLANIDSVETLVGTYTDGNVFSLKQIDGNSYNVTEVVGIPGFEIGVNFSEVRGFRRVDINSYYSGNLGHDVLVLLYNYPEAKWDSIGEIIDSGSYVDYSYAIENSDSYVAGGKTWMLINHTSPGNINHDISTDSVSLRTDEFCLLQLIYRILVWVFWVGLAGFSIGILIKSLNALKKPLE